MVDGHKDGGAIQIRASILTLTFLSIALLSARDKNDAITLDNGDRLTGEIKQLKAGVLYVDLDYVDGTIAVQWSKVDRMESRQLFIVQAQDGSRHTGSLATTERPSGRPVEIQITEETGGKVTLDRSSVASLNET